MPMDGRVYRTRRVERDEPESLGKGALLLLRDIAICFAVIFIVLQFVRPSIVFEHSMEDTLHPNDYIFLAKQAYRFEAPRRGDIVIFKSHLASDTGGTKNLIKRIIGLPGDTIEIRDGDVYVNGTKIEETYTKDGFTPGDMPPYLVAVDEYFMMGDNREVSLDSRSAEVGCIPMEDILGRVVFRLLPISSAGPVKRGIAVPVFTAE